MICNVETEVQKLRAKLLFLLNTRKIFPPIGFNKTRVTTPGVVLTEHKRSFFCGIYILSSVVY